MSEQANVEHAQEQLLALTPILEVEEVALLDALGRVLATDATSDIDVAPFDNSAMDGFAVRTEDLSAATADDPAHLEVVAHIGAGDWFNGALAVGQVARIMTGAPVPEGADSVVKVEDTAVVSGEGGIGSTIAFYAPSPAGRNIRLRGEEVMTGEVVLTSGEVIGPAAIGLLAATGHPHVKVYRRPRVAVVSTGSELVEADVVPTRGQIRNSNSYSIAAQVRAAGGIPIDYPCIADTYEATREVLLKAAAECDFVLTSGGVSVGDFDYVKPVLEQIGKLHYYNVNMRPGKPQTMGVIEGVPFFGLPGNPTSTFVGFEIFIRPALRKMQGYGDLFRPAMRARITHDVHKRPQQRYFLRGTIAPAGAGSLEGAGECAYECTVQGSQSSALLKAAHRANALIVLPEGTDLVDAGSMVDCIRLDIDEGVAL